MNNCKPGDIAIITCDEAGCMGNVGKRVRVLRPNRLMSQYGLTWLIKPYDYSDCLLFLQLGKNGDVLHLFLPANDRVEHPDKWLMPIGNRKDLCGKRQLDFWKVPRNTSREQQKTTNKEEDICQSEK